MATERDRMRKDMAARASDAGPLTRRLHALAVFLPHFERPDFALGEWVRQEGKPDWYRLSRIGRDFLEYCYDNGWIQGFDWAQWGRAPEGRRLTTDREALAGASPMELSRLLTSLVRQDRLAEGALDGAYGSGLLTAIVRRAAALAAAPPAESAETDWITWWGMSHQEQREKDAAFKQE